MNIRDYWPISTEELSIPTWEKMLTMRLQTFQGFANIEKDRGFIQPKIHIHTSQGQEVIRMLCFRFLEEVGEAFESGEDDHYYEELIDAFNYIVSILLLAGEVPTDLAAKLTSVCIVLQSETARSMEKDLTPASIGWMTISLGAKLGDSLRNRAWMNNSQNTFVDLDLFEFLLPIFSFIICLFPDFKTFYSYFVAKDSVLQFRLRSKY